MWRPQLDALEARFPCHAMDLPGHGEEREDAFTMEAAEGVVTAHLEREGSTATVLVGLSLGGYVALSAAARGTPGIAGLVLSGSAVHYRGFLRAAARLNLVAMRLYSQRSFERHWNKQLRARYPAATADAMLSAGVSMAGARDGLREVLSLDVPALVASISTPILLLNGERDRLNVRGAAVLARSNEHVRTQTLSGAGHLCSLDQPQAFADAVAKFASRVSAGC